jgi:hypothetical protein
MELFNTAGENRGNNDANNKAREDFLVSLYDSIEPSHQELRQKWQEFLKTLCVDPYTRVVVKKRGGRSANYDFDISYFMNDALVKHVKAEFKHNSDSIAKLPEYFSPAADKPYIPRLYADFFYEFLDRICAVYPEVAAHKPERGVYLRLVHGNDYDRHPFFRTLYDMEKAGTPEQAKQKQNIVKESIRSYLTEFSSTLNLSTLSSDIRERQSGKVFILWNLREFKSDFIREDEMEITHVEQIKNGNVVIAVSKAGTNHNMLLRWKNHLGILYPAWQISLTR